MSYDPSLTDQERWDLYQKAYAEAVTLERKRTEQFWDELFHALTDPKPKPKP